MPALPTLSGREVAHAFELAGWIVPPQHGSHIIRVKDGHIASLSVSDHKEVAKGTLRSLMRAAGLPVDEFIGLARR